MVAISQAKGGKCLDRQVFDPCVCEYQTIKCEGNRVFDLKAVFNKISKSLNHNEKGFQLFVLNNSAIQSLQSNTFADITFKILIITDVRSLETIDRMAFNGTAQHIEVFDMNGDNSLKNISQLFEAMSSFRNVIIDWIEHWQTWCHCHRWPSTKWIVYKKWQSPTLSCNMCPTILSLSSTNPKLSLLLDLSNNNLSEFSFDSHSLSGVNRPIELDLKDNHISVLEPKIFLRLLADRYQELYRPER